MLPATSNLPINFAVDAARKLENLCKEKVTYFKENPTTDGIVDAAKIKKLERLIAALIAYIDLLEREKITALGDAYMQHCMAELDAAIKAAKEELKEFKESEEDFHNAMGLLRIAAEKIQADYECKLRELAGLKDQYNEKDKESIRLKEENVKLKAGVAEHNRRIVELNLKIQDDIPKIAEEIAVKLNEVNRDFGISVRYSASDIEQHVRERANKGFSTVQEGKDSANEFVNEEYEKYAKEHKGIIEQLKSDNQLDQFKQKFIGDAAEVASSRDSKIIEKGEHEVGINKNNENINKNNEKIDTVEAEKAVLQQEIQAMESELKLKEKDYSLSKQITVIHIDSAVIENVNFNISTTPSSSASIISQLSSRVSTSDPSLNGEKQSEIILAAVHSSASPRIVQDSSLEEEQGDEVILNIVDEGEMISDPQEQDNVDKENNGEILNVIDEGGIIPGGEPKDSSSITTTPISTADARKQVSEAEIAELQTIFQPQPSTGQTSAVGGAVPAAASTNTPATPALAKPEEKAAAEEKKKRVERLEEELRTSENTIKKLEDDKQKVANLESKKSYDGLAKVRGIALAARIAGWKKEELKPNGIELITKIKQSTDEARTNPNVDKDKLDGLMQSLKDPLPALTGVDFSDENNAKDTIASTVASVFDIDAQQNRDKKAIENEISKKIVAMGIEQDKAMVLAKQSYEFLQLRILLNAKNRLSSLDELTGTKFDEQLEEIKKREEEYEEIRKKGVFKSDAHVTAKFTPEEKKNLEEQKTGLRIAPGLYGQMGEDGKPFYTFTDNPITESNIDAVIDRIDDRSIIWNNINSSQHELIRKKCLLAGKTPVFQNTPSLKFGHSNEYNENIIKPKPLEITMPNRPEDYFSWLKNIDKKIDWKKQNGVKKELIRGVIGHDDPARLNRFWQQIVKNGDSKMIADVSSFMTAEQKKILGPKQLDVLQQNKENSEKAFVEVNSAEEKLKSANLEMATFLRDNKLKPYKKLDNELKKLESQLPDAELNLDTRLKELDGFEKRLEELENKRKELLAQRVDQTDDSDVDLKRLNEQIAIAQKTVEWGKGKVKDFRTTLDNLKVKILGGKDKISKLLAAHPKSKDKAISLKEAITKKQDKVDQVRKKHAGKDGDTLKEELSQIKKGIKEIESIFGIDQQRKEEEKRTEIERKRREAEEKLAQVEIDIENDDSNEDGNSMHTMKHD